MQSLLFLLVDFVRGRWLSFKAEVICGSCVFKVACLLALLVWRHPDELSETIRRLWSSHGTDQQAWGVMLCLSLLILTIVFFEWMRRAYRKNRKEAEWRTSVIRLP